MSLPTLLLLLSLCLLQLPLLCLSEPRTATAATTTSITANETTCNGLSNLCQMPVNEILYGTVHNAMSSPQAGFVLFANHNEDPIVAALDAGYRGLQLDLCNCEGDFIFCHGGREVGCGIGQRDPVTVFDQISNWIISHPRNILIVELQINQLAGGPITLEDVQRILDEVPNGFFDRLYHHDPANRTTWPTLNELIDAETQILFFYKNGPNGSGYHPPGINYFYDFGMATHWSYSTVEDLRNRTIGSCSLRGSGETQDFFMMNAFVTAEEFGIQFVAPSQDAAQIVNTIEFSQPMLEACEQYHGKKVNIITVDFWNEGNLPALVDLHNSMLTANGTTSSSQPTPTPAPTTTTAGEGQSSTETPTTLPSNFSATLSTLPSSLPTIQPSFHPSNLPTHIPTHTSATPTLAPSSSSVQTTGATTSTQSPEAYLRDGSISSVKRASSSTERRRNSVSLLLILPTLSAVALPTMLW